MTSGEMIKVMIYSQKAAGYIIVRGSKGSRLRGDKTWTQSDI